MKRTQQTPHLKPYKNLIVILIILSAFIFGLLSITNLYALRTKDSYAYVLDKALFAAKTSNEEDSPFAVDKIVRFTIPYRVLTYDLLDFNTADLMFIDPQGKTFSVQTGVYDLAKGYFTADLEQKEHSSQGVIQVSPDGKTVLTSFYGKTAEFKNVFIYDIANKKNIGSLHNVLQTAWLPDSHQFAGLDDYLFIYDITTGRRENLYKLSAYFLKPNINSLNLNVLQDGETVCVTGSDGQGSSDIALLNLKTKALTTSPVKGYLYQSFPHDSNAIAYIGTANGQYGLYSYNAISKEITPMLNLENTKQKIGEISISPDGRKIAYITIGTNSIITMHMASLSNNRITQDEIVYQDSKYTSNMIWTKDSRVLYYLQNDSDSAVLGRILFKNL